MKIIIKLSTRRGASFDLTVEAYSGMIHLSAAIDGSEYYLVRLPQELKQWPILKGNTLTLSVNYGSDFSGSLKAELDDESVQRLNVTLGEASRRVNDSREYEDVGSEDDARELLAQLRADAEADTAPIDADFSLFDD